MTVRRPSILVGLGVLAVLAVVVGLQVMGDGRRDEPYPPAQSLIASPSPDMDLVSFDDILTVDRVPAASIVALLGSAGQDPPADSLCEALGVDVVQVRTATGVDSGDLEPVADVFGSSARCVWRTSTLPPESDGNGDGLVDLLSVSAGTLAEDDQEFLLGVDPDGVVTTPQGLVVRTGRLDPANLPDTDPGVQLDLWELDVGTDLSVGVSVGVDQPESVAAVLMDRVVEVLEAGDPSLVTRG